MNQEESKSKIGSHNHSCCCRCHYVPGGDHDSADAFKEVDGHKNMINIKSKRKRYLFRKGIELSQMCKVQVLILVRDTDQDRITMYCSGKKEDGVYSPEEAFAHIRGNDGSKKSVKVFTDDDYKDLDLTIREYNKKKPKKKTQVTVQKKRGRPPKKSNEKILNGKR